MELKNRILDFKKERAKFKKETLSTTLASNRLKNMTNAVIEKEFVFGMLNRSEQIDFFLYYAELAMANSGTFNLTPVSCEK